MSVQLFNYNSVARVTQVNMLANDWSDRPATVRSMTYCSGVKWSALEGSHDLGNSCSCTERFDVFIQFGNFVLLALSFPVRTDQDRGLQVPLQI
jgi:hypothetical protein